MTSQSYSLRKRWPEPQLAGASSSNEDVPARLWEDLRSTLPQGAPSLEKAARALCLSARTLQRRLAEHGTSFQEMLDAMRRDVALRTIADRGVPLVDVAKTAGFGDERAFRRAFRRWTGMSPRCYRLTLAAGSDPS